MIIRKGAQQRAKPRVCFYAPLHEIDDIERIGFYHNDVKAIRAAAAEVTVAVRYRDLALRSDIFFVWWWSHALPIVLWALLTRRRVYITGTFNWGTQAPGDFAARPWWQRYLMLSAARLATANLIPSRAEAKKLTRDACLANVVYYPHCVTDESSHLDGSTREGSPAFSGSPSQRLERLTGQAFMLSLAWSGSGNLRRKCVFELIEAFELLPQSHPDFLLVLAGNTGDGEKELRERVARSAQAARIVLLGRVNELEKHWLMNNCVVFASPSKFEGFGLAIVEAAAKGVPIVTSRVGAIEEVLGDSGPYYCDGTCPRSIADALKAVLDDPVAARLAAVSSKESAEQFTFSAKVVRTSKILAGHL